VISAIDFGLGRRGRPLQSEPFQPRPSRAS
jgi:hypothetical protein